MIKEITEEEHIHREAKKKRKKEKTAAQRTINKIVNLPMKHHNKFHPLNCFQTSLY